MKAKRIFKTKPLYFRLIFGFFSGLVITIFAILVINFIKIQEKNKQEIINLQYSLLTNIESNFQSVVNGTIDNLNLLYRNQDIRKLFDMDKLEMSTSNVRAIQSMRNILENDDYISGIYVMNDSGVIASVENTFSSDLAKKDMVEMIEAGNFTEGYICTSMESRYESMEPSKVLCMYIMDGFMTDQSCQSGIAITLDLEKLQQRLYSVSQAQITEKSFFTVDEEGSIIMHSDMKLFLHPWNNQVILRQLIENTEDYTVLEAEQDGDTQQIFALKVKGMPYYMGFITDQPLSSAYSDKFFQDMLWVIAGSILIAGILSILIAKILYRPIEKLILNIRKIVGKNNQSLEVAELPFLEETVRNMAEQLHNMEDTSNYQIIKELEKGDISNYQALEKLFSGHLASSIVESNYVLAVFSVDSDNSAESKSNGDSISLLLNSMEPIIKKHFELCCCFVGEVKKLILLLPVNNEEDLPQVKEKLKYASEQIYIGLGISLTIGVSELSRGISVIKQLYMQAQNYIKYQLFFAGERSVIDSAMVNSLKNEPIPEKIGNNIVDALKKADFEGYQRELHRTLELCKKYRYSYAIELLGDVISKITRLIAIAYKGNQLTVYDNMADIYTEITACASPENLIDFFVSIYRSASCILQETNESTTTSSMKEILDFIQENYMNAEMSATMLAGKLGITTQYFSKQFKETTGVSLPDYVTSLRLEKSAELLLQTDLNIKDIAEKVGFRSTAYYGSSFKKVYGITPSAYRTANSKI